MIKINRILLSRTDSIGDVILTLPMAGIIKKHFPDTSVYFLGRNYTQPVIELSRFVDQFVSMDAIEGLTRSKQEEFVRDLDADCIIHVFPGKNIARLAFRAGIKLRIGTSHRIYNFRYCNCRVNLSRKNSDLHESKLNLELLKPLGINENIPLDHIPEYYGIQHQIRKPEKLGTLIDPGKFNLIIHPRSKGSAREWGLGNFNSLIEILPEEKFKVFVTGTVEEGKLMKEFLNANVNRITDLTGKLSLRELIDFIGMTDGLVAASTGPLHIAAALGKQAIGIYPPIRPMHPGRWAPLGRRAKFLVLDKECNDCRKSMDCSCIKKINPSDVKDLLEE